MNQPKTEITEDIYLTLRHSNVSCKRCFIKAYCVPLLFARVPKELTSVHPINAYFFKQRMVSGLKVEALFS